MRNKSHDLFQKALALLEKGSAAEAKALFAKVLRNDPNHLDANYLMGTLCAEDGDYSRGEQLLRKALRMQPDSPYILNNLGNVYHMQSKDREALDCYEKALKIKSDLPQAHCNLGVIYKVSGDLEKARKHFETAQKLEPGMDKARAGLASLQEREGDYRQAKSSLERALNDGVCDMHTIKAYAEAVLHDDSSPAELQRAHQLAEELVSSTRGGTLSGAEEAKIYYLLGALNDHLADYDRAFTCYQTANKKSSGKFNLKNMQKKVMAIGKKFNRDILEQSASNEGVGSNLIFIIGMPRSGSTLVEQILDSHPDVGSLGECDVFARQLSAISNKSSNAPLSQEQATMVARQYEDFCRQQHPHAKVFSDKTLSNYLCLGQISQVFPEARIIHCKRNPVDTCLSCYFHDFAGQYEFTNDLTSLGHYYNLYQGLMEQWHEVLGDRIYDLVYEDLIADSKGGIKSLLTFCGLKFNRACLKFYKNKRVVNTASYYQVRKPIYQSSVNRSYVYKEHLEPLFKILNG